MISGFRRRVRSLLFSDVTQRTLVVTDVSAQSVVDISPNIGNLTTNIVSVTPQRGLGASRLTGPEPKC